MVPNAGGLREGACSSAFGRSGSSVVQGSARALLFSRVLFDAHFSLALCLAAARASGTLAHDMHAVGSRAPLDAWLALRGSMNVSGPAQDLC